MAFEGYGEKTRMLDEAVKKGYERELCSSCNKATVVRNGTALKCTTCGDVVETEETKARTIAEIQSRAKLMIPPTSGYERKSRAAVADVMSRVFAECSALREAGQKEYAHDEDNAFANFERVAERLGISREMALLVYAEKYWDGIASYVKGHKSQRDSVKGRLNDMIVYLCLLRAMVEEAGE